MRFRQDLSLGVLIILCSCASERVVRDSSADRGPPPADSGSAPCPSGTCTLACDPNESRIALATSSANDPNIVALGDAEPASADDVGDGRYHLFVGVFHEDDPGCDGGNAFLHDGVSSAPDGPYTIANDPILPIAQLEPYHRCGVETPSYIRADGHTEYLYYCALSAPNVASIALLRRRDGSAWEKLGPVVPMSAGQTSQCEADVVREPSSGLYFLYYQGAFSDGTSGLFYRTSHTPERFEVDTETRVQNYGPAGVLSRPSVSFDPYDQVLRYSFDIDGYGAIPPASLAQTWSESARPDLLVLKAHGGILHSPDHDTHPAQHLRGRGNVDQNGGALYPDKERVLFFYSGHVPLAGSRNGMQVMQVNVQPCRRKR